MDTITVNFQLANLEETEKLGEALASLLNISSLNKNKTIGSDSSLEPLPVVLLNGELGAGKTSLCRSIVLSSLHGLEADFSSPSFNIYNIYPTNPLIIHADLYRLAQNSSPDEELLEFMENGTAIMLIEWAERLPNYLFPSTYLSLNFSLVPDDNTEFSQMRNIDITAKGKTAEWILEQISLMFKK